MHLQVSLLAESLDQLDHEQRVSRRPGQLPRQHRAGWRAGHRLGQRDDRRVVQSRQRQLGCAVAHQLIDHLRQLGAFREGSQRDQQRHRQVGQGSTDGADGAQGGRIGPVQVLEGDDDRPVGGQSLQQGY